MSTSILIVWPSRVATRPDSASRATSPPTGIGWNMPTPAVLIGLHRNDRFGWCPVSGLVRCTQNDGLAPPPCTAIVRWFAGMLSMSSSTLACVASCASVVLQGGAPLATILSRSSNALSAESTSSMAVIFAWTTGCAFEAVTFAWRAACRSAWPCCVSRGNGRFSYSCSCWTKTGQSWSFPTAMFARPAVVPGCNVLSSMRAQVATLLPRMSV